MGHIQKRPNGKWKARYVAPDGRERSKTFARKVDAERFLAGVEVAKMRGEWTDPRLGRVTVSAWSERWLKAQVQLKPSTRATYESLLRHQVLPTWGNVPLAELSHADVAAWVAGLTAKGLAGSTVRQAYRVLSLMLDLAVRDGRIARNGADGVKLPAAHVRPKQFLTHQQVYALAEACGPYRALVLVLAYTGLRFGEAAALRVRSLDLLRSQLDVIESVTEVNGRLVFGTTKTDEHRPVAIPPPLRAELSARCAGKGPDDLVFTAPQGGPLWERNFRRRYFDRAAVQVGLAGLVPHELRSTAASLARAEGADVKDIQQMLGHKSAAMTLDVYSALFPGHLEAVAERLGKGMIEAATAYRRPDLDSEVVPINRAKPQNAI